MKSVFFAACFVSLIVAVMAECWPLVAVCICVFLAVALWDCIYGEEFED